MWRLSTLLVALSLVSVAPLAGAAEERTERAFYVATAGASIGYACLGGDAAAPGVAVVCFDIEATDTAVDLAVDDVGAGTSLLGESVAEPCAHYHMMSETDEQGTSHTLAFGTFQGSLQDVPVPEGTSHLTVTVGEGGQEDTTGTGLGTCPDGTGTAGTVTATFA